MSGITLTNIQILRKYGVAYRQELSLNKQKKKKHRDKKRDKDKELQASLMVACLKRLLPVGLNLFAGREQELVQHCKDRFLRVIK